MARCVGQRHVDRPVSRRAFDGARTIGNTATSRNLPRSGGAARRARCRHRVRSRQASCGLRQLRRAAPASIGSTATVRVTVGTATRQRTRATLPSCPTRAASRRGAARFAHPVRGRRTSWAASFSAGACHWRQTGSPAVARWRRALADTERLPMTPAATERQETRFSARPAVRLQPLKTRCTWTRPAARASMSARVE